MRRKRSRGNWMPTLGHILDTGEATINFADQIIIDSGINFAPTAGQTRQVGPFPLLPDFSSEQQGADIGASLHDRVTGNAWSLNRIVGKLHIECTPGDSNLPEVAWRNIFVVAGFFVARADDGNQSICDLTGAETDPQEVNNIDNPWIWRRSWVLANPAFQTNTGFSFAQGLPSRTNQFGSVLDGPHIDSKVKRFIQKEHRLWWTISMRGFDPNFVEVSGLPENQPGFAALLDYRIHGSLRRSRNSSSM